MAITALSGFNPAVSLITALNPTRQVNSLSVLGGFLSLASSQTSISSLGRLLNDVESLQSAATALSAPGAFAARTVASSQASVATATATADTPIGAYTLRVDRLAQAQTLTTAAQISSQSAIGSGAPSTLSFQFASGGSREVSLASGSNTLAGIAAAINDAGIGVEAEVISSAAGSRLALTGQTGAANAFSIGVTGDTDVAALLAYPPGSNGPTLTAQAQDAQGLVNGTAFTASTNTVNTAVPGLTLTLQATGTSTLSVAPNLDQTSGASAFVTAYNAVQNGLAQLGEDNPGLGFSVSLLQSQLSAALNTGIDIAGGSAASLAQIGITGNADRTLTLDSRKFQSALNANPDSIARLFSNQGNGVAEQVAAQAEGALAPSNLLQIAAPALNPFATLGESLQNNLFSNLDQLGSLGSTGLSSSLSDQFLLAQLSGSSQFGSGQDNDQLLNAILSQQALAASLASLGTQLSLSRLL